jgi:hypothetical protein
MVVRMLAATVAVLVMLCLVSTMAFGQCSLASPDQWQTAGTGQWTDGGNWSGGVPTASTNVCITNGTMADPTVVNLTGGQNGNVDSLQLGGFDTLNIDANSDFTVSGTQIINAGQINLNSGAGGNTILILDNNVTLSGGGTLTLVTAGGASAYIEQGAGGLTLTNQSTIDGAGIIGNSGLALNNQGTIDANSSGQTLFLNGGGITNSSLMEATGGGILQITNSQTVNNAGGTIMAGAGSSVQMQGSAVIQGGTLTNNGTFLGVTNGGIVYLDGSTGAGAVTINGTYTSDVNTYTYLRGSIINNGTIQLNGGGGANVVLWTDSANVTLTGGGTLNLGNLGGGGTAIITQAVGGTTLTNVNNLIEGQGILGDGSGLLLVNQATVNANVSGQNLILDGGGITNTGTLEATNGGALVISVQTVNNQNGNITAGAGSSVVLESAVVQGGTLTNNGSFLGATIGGIATLDGSTASGAVTINGTYTSDINSYTYLRGTITNQGTIQINAGGGDNTILWTDSGNVTLQGGGTLNLATVSGGSAIIAQAAGGETLTNVNNTIEGMGIIGNGGGLVLVNEATVNANVSGQTLLLDGGGVTNTGLLEATNGGTLEITGETVTNSGANITAGAGSSVLIDGNAHIVGGTLTDNGTFLGTAQGASAYLDGSTAGALTINGTYTSALNTDTYLLGTINNNGNFQINGGSGFTTLLLTDSGTVTLQGGGTVTLSSSTAGGSGDAYIAQAAGGETLINVNNTIQGEGIIGDNGLTLINQAGGTINANSTGVGVLTTLTLDNVVLTNAGLIEATNNGVLNIDGVTVNNAGGTITGIGSGTSVNFYANTTIEGGTLTNNGSAFFGTTAGNSAFLDGSTLGAITINGTYTSDLNTDTYLKGTINNNGAFQINGGSGLNTLLLTDSPSVTLQGGGTVTLSSFTAGGGGNAYIAQAAGGETLTNVNNTIQGDGIIGDNGLTLINTAGGTINANSTGVGQLTTLTLNNLNLTNEGLVEATNNGVLGIDGVTVNNAGGTITGIGAGASVQLYGSARIDGGTLTNNGAAFFGTLASGSAFLDGSTGAGAVTINGTYTADVNSDTYLLGTINNRGTIQVNGGGGTSADLWVDNANVTLTGGGIVNLSTAAGGGGAFILQAAGGSTLENVNNTIQGVGLIGDNSLSLLNDAAGTILANVSGGTLTLDGIGTLTNNGTFQVNAGSTLLVENVTDFTNFSGNTLTGGTYNVYGTVSNPGTMQLSVLGNTGGEIVNNAATILLDGPNSNITDAAGLDALSNFHNNEAAGSFTIQDGRNFTGPSNTNFTNAGIVNIGSGSTFTTGGTGNYIQSAGTTQLNGTLTAGGGSINFNGGVLFGNGGVINGNVMMAGAIVPAASINSMGMPINAGMLQINGNYTQTAAGIFNLGLGGTTAGTQFGLLNISGNANLDGTLNVSLINGFFPTNGEIFKFLTTGGTVNSQFATYDGLNIGDGLVLEAIYGSNFVELEAMPSTNTDNWLGGTGNWSNGAKWSIGVPTPPDDVFIYSGGNDLVTLNVGSSTINSLAVGGPTNGFTSELTDGGTAQSLTITTSLTVGQQGTLYFFGNGSSITAATVSNDGFVDIGKGASLNLTGQPLGVTDVPTGAVWTIGGNFEVGGVANTGFANLASIEGAVELQNGQSWTIAPSLLTISGTLDVSDGTTVTIMAGVNNSGTITTGDLGTGGNTLTITGTLTNDGYFAMFGSGDIANIDGDLDNHVFATVDLEGGSTLNVTGNFDNRGVLESYQSRGNTVNVAAGSGTLTNEAGGIIDVENGSELTINGNVTNTSTGVDRGIITGFLGTGGNTLDITGTLNNTSNGNLQLLGSGDKATIGSLTNAGFVDVEGGSTLTITGDVTNSGAMYTSFNGPTGGNTLNITGSLTNSGFVGLENTDTATISGNLTNNGTGTFDLTGGGKATVGGNLMNTAATTTVDLENASTLKITGTADNFGTLTAGANGGTGGNTITITGALTNEAGGTFELYGHGSADMASIGGSVTNSGFFYVYNGSTATIGNGLTTSGTVDLENGSTLNITGNTSNSGDFYTDFSGGGGNNTVTITGTLDNTGLVWLKGAGDKATITGNVTNELDAELFLFGGSKATMPGLTNAGTVDVEGGSTLQVNGAASNSGNLYTDQQGSGGGNSINITGALTNSGTFELYGLGDTATLGSLTNSGTADVEHGSTLQINGNASNSGDFYTDFGGLGGNNTVNITGTLDNTGLVWLKGAGDKATITGAVTNELDAEIFLFAGSTATMDGGLNNAGTVDVEGGSTLQVNGNATNSGNLYTNQQGNGGNNTLNITGMLTNTGNFELFGHAPDMATIGSLTNSGTVDVFGGSALNVSGAFDNSGTLNTGGGKDPGGNTVTVTGLLTNEATGEIDLNGGKSGDVLQALAGLTNNGVINVNGGSSIDPPFVNNGGTINIGAGSKMIVGTGMPMGTGYIQLANGTLGEVINGYGPCGTGNCGLINVTGSALLAGTLDILLKQGFNPVVGSEFTILTSTPGQLSGVFSNIMNDCFNNDTECWTPTYDYQGGLLELTVAQNGPPPVSEPATLLVLIPGLLGMGYGLRRRLSK